jgi:hypothetical protein
MGVQQLRAPAGLGGPHSWFRHSTCRKLKDSKCSSTSKWDSVVGMVRSWTVRDSNPGRGKIVFLLQNRPDLLWVPPSPLFRGYQRSFLGINRLGREIHHSFPSSAEVKNEWNYTAAPHIRLHGENDNLTFTHLTATNTPKLNMLTPMSLWH